MKRCTNSGAALEGAASFCAECGAELASSSAEQVKKAEEEKKTNRREKKQKKTRKEKKLKKKKEGIEEVVGEPVDDGYDGYYNDVLPPDIDRIKEELDKDLIKKIVALSIGVFFIISMCVAMLYIL